MILFIGVSVFLCGKLMYVGFFVVKVVLCVMVQFMVWEFGLQGIYVGYVVIDGVVNGVIVWGLGGGMGKFVFSCKGIDGVLVLDEVVKQFLMFYE